MGDQACPAAREQVRAYRARIQFVDGFEIQLALQFRDHATRALQALWNKIGAAQPEISDTDVNRRDIQDPLVIEVVLYNA